MSKLNPIGRPGHFRLYRGLVNPQPGALGASTPLSILRGITGFDLDHIWAGELEDVGANPLSLDSILVLGGTATAGNAAAGVIAGNGLSELELRFPAEETDYARVTGSAAVGDPGLSNLEIVVFRGSTTHPTVSTNICGKKSSADGNTGMALGPIVGGKLRMFRDGGATAHSESTTVPCWYDGLTVAVAYQDLDAGLACIQTNLHPEQALEAGAQDCSSATTHFGFNDSEAGVGEGAPVLLGAVHVSADLNGLTATQIKAMADDIADLMITANVKTEVFKATHIAWQSIHIGLTDYGANGKDLALSGSASINSAATGLVAANGINDDTTILTTEAGTTDAAVAPDVDLWRSNDSAILIVGFKVTTAVGGNLSLWGHRVESGSFEGIEIAITVGGNLFLRYDWGAADISINLTNDHADGAYHWLALLVDDTAKDVEFESDLDTNVVVAITALSDAAVIGAFGEQRLNSCDSESPIILYRRAVDVEGEDLGVAIAGLDAVMVS